METILKKNYQLSSDNFFCFFSFSSLTYSYDLITLSLNITLKKCSTFTQNHYTKLNPLSIGVIFPRFLTDTLIYVQLNLRPNVIRKNKSAEIKTIHKLAQVPETRPHYYVNDTSECSMTHRLIGLSTSDTRQESPTGMSYDYVQLNTFCNEQVMSSTIYL